MYKVVLFESRKKYMGNIHKPEEPKLNNILGEVNLPFLSLELSESPLLVVHNLLLLLHVLTYKEFTAYYSKPD